MAFPDSPYVADPTFAAKRAAYMRQLGMQQSNLQFERGNTQQQEAFQTGQLGQNIGRARQRLPGQYAHRGLLNSGIYGNSLLQHSQDASNQYRDLSLRFGAMYGQNDMGQQKARLDYDFGMADLDRQEADARAALANQVRGVL